jgi:hypothetical protein
MHQPNKMVLFTVYGVQATVLGRPNILGHTMILSLAPPTLGAYVPRKLWLYLKGLAFGLMQKPNFQPSLKFLQVRH